MVKYLGSKRKLIPLLVATASALPTRSALDVFSGTSRVGAGLRGASFRVHANDLGYGPEQLAVAYLLATDTDRAAYEQLMPELMALPGLPDHWFVERYSREARYFQEQNSARVAAIREYLQTLQLPRVQQGLALTSLMEAADRVDSTVGVQMAYLKQWAARSFNDLELRVPARVDGPVGEVTRGDALDAVQSSEAELAYLDPPYNQHSYAGNYHLWETVVRWDNPDVYGIAAKRTDTRENKSAYNSKVNAPATLAACIEAVQAPWLMLSMSAEGYHDVQQLVAWAGARRHVRVLAVGHDRYVGARIGQHNLKGERIAEAAHTRTVEYLLLAGPQAGPLNAAVDAAHAAELAVEDPAWRQ